MEQGIEAIYMGAAIILICIMIGMWQRSEKVETQIQKGLVWQYNEERLLIDSYANAQMWGLK